MSSHPYKTEIKQNKPENITSMHDMRTIFVKANVMFLMPAIYLISHLELL